MRRTVGELEVGDVFRWEHWVFIVTSDRRQNAEIFNVLKYCDDGEFCSESCFGVDVEVVCWGKDISFRPTP